MTSCMLVVSSLAIALHFSARSASSRRPRELAAGTPAGRLVVRLVDVRERHGLAAVLLADRLVVRQVDADRRHRTGVAGFDRPRRSRWRRRRWTPCFRYFGSHGIRSSNHCAAAASLRIPSVFSRIDVVDQRLPRALDAAGVHVDLDEAVDRIDGRRLVLDPRDVVRDAVGGLAGLIEPDQRAQRVRHRLGRDTGWPPRGARRSPRSARRSGRRRGRPLRRSRRRCFTSRELSG